MDMLYTSVPMEPIPPRPATSHRYIHTTTRIANSWTASWHGLQQGNGLQAGTISELQISIISLGGVIGGGLLVGSGTALRHAGPGGIVVGYAITGSVVYCVNRSVAEIVSCFPRSGGPVGLAHLYVDPALGFGLGWLAYYNWFVVISLVPSCPGLSQMRRKGVRDLFRRLISTIMYPTQIAVGSILITIILDETISIMNSVANKYYACIAISISITLCFSLLGTRYYGRLETIFSLVKICTIIWTTIHCFVLAAKQEDFFGYWKNPGAFATYRSTGALGHFLGIWSVQLQACFSFFGTEVAVMMAAEVRRPDVSILAVARKTWIWIFVFYVVGVFGPGLLVPHDHEILSFSSSTTKAWLSPFIVAFWNYEDPQRPRSTRTANVATAFFALAAFSAALTNVFISSRLLFFLSKCGHAPEWCSKVINMPFALGRVPIVGTVVIGAFGTLAYMALSNAWETFEWLSTMTSTAALSSWIGMLVTYLKWIHGIETAVKRANGGEPVFVRFVEKYRGRFPTGRARIFAKLRAWYALIMCSAILLFNGWAVFTVPDQWIIATTPDNAGYSYGGSGENAGYSYGGSGENEIVEPAATFVTSYLPIPFMLLLVYGYKLINRTQAVAVEDMIRNIAHEWDQQVAAEEQAQGRDLDQPPGRRAHQPRSFYRFVRDAFAFIFCCNSNRH